MQDWHQIDDIIQYDFQLPPKNKNNSKWYSVLYTGLFESTEMTDALITAPLNQLDLLYF